MPLESASTTPLKSASATPLKSAMPLKSASATPLTRHFYEQDEVQAALFYAGSRRRPQETVFWCHELLLSGWASEAIRVLFESWLWNYGPFYPEWYREAWERLSPAEITAEDILYCAHRLSQGPAKDHSLWKLLTISACHHPSLYDAVTPRSPPAFPSEDVKEQFFVRALYQRKATSAWWAACYFSVERFWELVEAYHRMVGGKDIQWMTRLREYEPLLGYSSEGYDRAIRAVVVLSLCLSPAPAPSTAPALPVVPAFDLPPVGRRASRLYPIPMECLYGTRRSRMPRTRTTVGSLNDVERGIRGCPFWEEALGSDLSDGQWVSEEAMEQFYETHFPDDLPDEWTRAEKEKSHGPGLYGGEPLTLDGYGRRMFFSTARLVWLSPKVPALPLSSTPFDDLLACEPDVPPVSESVWKPVHKRRVPAH